MTVKIYEQQIRFKRLKPVIILVLYLINQFNYCYYESCFSWDILLSDSYQK